MARSAVMNFMKQQGFTQEPPDRAALRFKGLQFQPTIVGAMMLVAILTQSPAIFLLVSALLWLNVLLPAANPFEQVYNRFVARRRGRPPLTPAPGPRRFAQGMAAVFMLAAGLTLLPGSHVSPGGRGTTVQRRGGVPTSSTTLPGTVTNVPGSSRMMFSLANWVTRYHAPRRMG